jgi:hypothetical protein
VQKSKYLVGDIKHYINTNGRKLVPLREAKRGHRVKLDKLYAVKDISQPMGHEDDLTILYGIYA